MGSDQRQHRVVRHPAVSTPQPDNCNPEVPPPRGHGPEAKQPGRPVTRQTRGCEHGRCRHECRLPTVPRELTMVTRGIHMHRRTQPCLCGTMLSRELCLPAKPLPSIRDRCQKCLKECTWKFFRANRRHRKQTGLQVTSLRPRAQPRRRRQRHAARHLPSRTRGGGHRGASATACRRHRIGGKR